MKFGRFSVEKDSVQSISSEPQGGLYRPTPPSLPVLSPLPDPHPAGNNGIVLRVEPTMTRYGPLPGKEQNGIYTDERELEIVPGEKDQVPVVKQEAKPQNSLRNTLIGCLLALLSAFLLAVGQGCIQLIDGAVGDFQLVAMRTFFQGCIGASFFVRKRKLPRVPRHLWFWVFALSFSAVSVNLLFGIGIRYIPAGVSGCLRRCTDLIGVTILSIILLKERLTIVKGLCLGICLGGVVMMIQPWYERPSSGDGPAGVTISPENYTSGPWFPTTDGPAGVTSSPGNSSLWFPTTDGSVTEPTTNTTNTDDGGSELSGQVFGYTVVSVAGVASSAVTLITKYKLYTLNAWTMNLYIGLLGFTVTGTIALITEEITMPSETDKIIYVTIQTLVWGTAALSRLKATSLAPALLVTMVMSMQIVFLLIGQYTVLNQIQPGIGNWVEIVGMVLVLISIITPPGWEVLKSRTSGDKSPVDAPSEGTSPLTAPSGGTSPLTDGDEPLESLDVRL